MKPNILQFNQNSWMEEAKLIISKCRPKMIVFDLDFTLWPTYFAEHTLSPYIPLHGVDDYQNQPSSVLCIDRLTKKPRILSLYQDILSIISFCVENHILLSICSKSSNYEAAEEILTSFGIWKYFQFPQIYYSRKTFHFRNLRGCTNFLYSDFLFFDDDPKNIIICDNIGVNGCLVDKSTGLTIQTFLTGLRQYSNQTLSSTLQSSQQQSQSTWNHILHSPPSSSITPNQKRLRLENNHQNQSDDLNYSYPLQSTRHSQQQQRSYSHSSFFFPEDNENVLLQSQNINQQSSLHSFLHSQSSSSLSSSNLFISTPPSTYRHHSHSLHSSPSSSSSNSSSCSSISSIDNNDIIHPSSLNLQFMIE